MRLAIPADARAVAQINAWTLYQLAPRADDSPLWLRFKLMLPPETPARWGERRSFSLYWNPLGLRFRKDRDAVALYKHSSDLYERVELLLSLEYGPEWLVRVAGMTLEEIEAEKARLAAYASERRAAKRQLKERTQG
ncbi:MAG: hypothetical protein IVW54_22900 [Candidatus Binataceae bacterium]|nr:hypothetical protein [Candidatus Binataceae bacterium]